MSVLTGVAMKRLIICFVAIAMLLTGCGSSLQIPATATSSSKIYPTYGLFNEDQYKSEKVCYETSVASVIVGIILIETIVVPIYILGWDFKEPVRMKNGPDDKCKAVD